MERMEKIMKKEYTNPELKKIEFDQLDVIATSGMDDNVIEGGVVGRNDTRWSNKY